MTTQTRTTSNSSHRGGRRPQTSAPRLGSGARFLAAIVLVQASLTTSLLAADTYLSVLGGEQIFGAAAPTAGYGHAILTMNELDMLCYSIRASQLEGSETDTEIWARELEAGAWTPVLSVAAQRTFVASPTTGCVGPLTVAEKSALEQGEFHILIRTEAFPEGEIQGRVVRMIGEGRSNEAPDAFGLETSDWRTIQALVALHEDQWVLLERLLKLTPDGWHLLKQVLGDGGEVSIGENGKLVFAPGAAPGLPAASAQKPPVRAGARAGCRYWWQNCGRP